MKRAKKGKVDIMPLLIHGGASAAGTVAGAAANKITQIGAMTATNRGLMKLAAGVGLPVLAAYFAPDVVKGTIGAALVGFCGGVAGIGGLELANATVFKAKPISIAGPGFDTLGAYSVQTGQVSGPGFDTLGGYSATTGMATADVATY